MDRHTILASSGELLKFLKNNMVEGGDDRYTEVEIKEEKMTLRGASIDVVCWRPNKTFAGKFPTHISSLKKLLQLVTNIEDQPIVVEFYDEHILIREIYL